MNQSLLGDFLRARRARLSPAEVGLVSHGPRRVPGLRREEVAVLASISADYYVRLEQGRERNPSAVIVDALATALRLDHDGRQHLYQLSGFSPSVKVSDAPEAADPDLIRLMESWSDCPALVLGRAYDVLASNRIGEELFGAPSNLMLKVFLDPAARAFYRDWDAVARSSVAGFRLLSSTFPDDPRIHDVRQQLLDRSGEFRAMWKEHHARGKTSEHKELVHPTVGHLRLHTQAFDVRSAPGQQLIVYQAEPDSISAANIALLGSIAATKDGPVPVPGSR